MTKLAEKRLKSIKKGFLILASVSGAGLLLWFLILGKIRAQQVLSPFLNKVPKSSEELKEAGKNVLGTAEDVATSQNAQKVLEEGSKFFETSTFTEPIRVIRENLIQQISETIVTLKELPAREVKTIKREVCKQWLEEEVVVSTSAASP